LKKKFLGYRKLFVFEHFGAGADWDQKAPATFHTKNPKGPFLTFCIGD
jgi:hypothetical protein